MKRPTISLESVQQAEPIVTGGWFPTDAAAVRRLLDEYQYEQVSGISWERAADAHFSVAMVTCESYQGFEAGYQIVNVVILERHLFREAFHVPFHEDLEVAA